MEPAYIFRGTNWKLSSDKKWQEFLDENTISQANVKLGTKNIKGSELEVYEAKVEGKRCFLAKPLPGPPPSKPTLLLPVAAGRIPIGRSICAHYSEFTHRTGWKKSEEKLWLVGPYLVNGKEKLVGTRVLDKREFDVYECLTEHDYIVYLRPDKS